MSEPKHELFDMLSAALAASEQVFAERFRGVKGEVAFNGAHSGERLRWTGRKLVIVGMCDRDADVGGKVENEKSFDNVSIAGKAASCHMLEPLYQKLEKASAEDLERVAKAVAQAKAFVEKHSPEET